MSTTTAVTRFRSVADAVDEVRVVPPLMKHLSTVTTQSPGGTTTVTNTFDGQGRITQTVSTAGWTATYSAWDSAGRPTVAVEVGPGLNNTRTMRYDDAARTRGTTSANVATLETFDANGNIVGYSTTAGGTAVSTMTSTTHATDRICK